MKTSIKYGLVKLRRLNLFGDNRLDNIEDEEIVRDQVLTTRVYLICLIASILSLTLFNLVHQMTVSVTIHNPSFNTYKYLEAEYPNTLSCPCSEVSTQYSTFMSINMTYHQVSAFILFFVEYQQLLVFEFL